MKATTTSDKMMSMIEIAIEIILALRIGLLMYLNPTSIVQLWRAIGSLASGPEMLEFASMATLLDIEMNGLRG